MKGSSSAAALTFVLAASASTGASAFAPAAGVGSGRAASAGTALNLLPTQGAQLAAFARASGAAPPADAAVAKAAPSSDPAIVNAAAENAPLIEVSFETPTEAAAARGIVSRLFSLPSIVRGSAGAAAAVGHPEMMVDMPVSFEADPAGEGDDVVLYPVVGFRWVRDGDGNGHVLPPMECRAACSLPNHKKEEEVHGWFSKACHLGNPHGSDEDYCSSPTP